ncbi:hypothetical protein [Gordonia sp. QH-12]|uniref:hypothetical protein n=1 Tax=Gordonia sp. QH-12 TaxID=1437876 RepID=UPI0012E8BB98|nr:hypothetical protein [Gordonia sp. QH-12]
MGYLPNSRVEKMLDAADARRRAQNPALKNRPEQEKRRERHKRELDEYDARLDMYLPPPITRDDHEQTNSPAETVAEIFRTDKPSRKGTSRPMPLNGDLPGLISGLLGPQPSSGSPDDVVNRYY